MKERISVTVEKETNKKIDDFLKDNKNFRNKSHLIESLIDEFIEKIKLRKKWESIINAGK